MNKAKDPGSGMCITGQTEGTNESAGRHCPVTVEPGLGGSRLWVQCLSLQRPASTSGAPQGTTRATGQEATGSTSRRACS